MTSENPLYESCPIMKTCSVCQRTRHNLEFYSNRKGRTALKSYCKHCKPIYEGIQKGLIPVGLYQGLDFNTEQLVGDSTGHVILLYQKSFEKISIIDATALVKQGGAHVTSSGTIAYLTQRLLKNNNLRSFILERDDHRCHYCSREGDTLDHVIPKSRGGLNTPLNLIACCRRCNQLKGDLSQKQFLKKIHNSKLNDPTLELKIAIRSRYNKKCVVCQRKRPIHEFDVHRNYCLNCAKFLSAFQLGYITSKEISRHHQNSMQLINSQIHTYDPSKVLIDQLDKSEAYHLVHNGMAKIVDKSSIQMLFNSNQLKRLFPHKTFHSKSTEMMSLQPDKPSKREIEKMTPGSSIGVYDKSGESAFTLQKASARQLLRQGNAYIIHKNRIKLTAEHDKFLQKHPEFLPFFFQTKKNIQHGCRLMERIGGLSIPFSLSQELVKAELAYPLSSRRIQLKYFLEEVILSIPELINHLRQKHMDLLLQSESDSNIELWEYGILALDPEAYTIKIINNGEAVQLVQNGAAEKKNRFSIMVKKSIKTLDKFHILKNKETQTV